MKSYADIKAQIAKLEKEADAALKQERAGVISRIREAIDVYGFTAQDLGFGGGARAKGKRRAAPNRKTATSTTVGVPKYRDPESGRTWTGRGKPPNWIVGVKDRDAFLIGGVSDSSASPAGAKRASGSSKGARGQRKAAGASGRRRNAGKGSRAARQTAVTPAVQMESGAATA